jgi:hypothetical protein
LRASHSLFSGLLSGLETQRQISELLNELYYNGLPLGGSSPREPVASHAPTEKRAVGGHVMDEMKLPRFDYHLDESDPDIVVLRRTEGGEEHYRALVEAHAESLRRQQDNEEE